jgi:hypothetical protein
MIRRPLGPGGGGSLRGLRLRLAITAWARKTTSMPPPVIRRGRKVDRESKEDIFALRELAPRPNHPYV